MESPENIKKDVGGNGGGIQGIQMTFEKNYFI